MVTGGAPTLVHLVVATNGPRARLGLVSKLFIYGERIMSALIENFAEST